MVEHRIILTGGGTGGHVYPALSVAEELKKNKDVKAILYIGAKGHIEERLAVERGLDFVGLSVSGLPRKLSGKLLSWPFTTIAAVGRALSIMSNFNPTAVLGTGGYASAPPLAAAGFMKVPYVVHEPDAHPGLVNRAFAGGASLISCGMAAAAETLKSKNGPTVVNGNPIRDSFVRPPTRAAAARLFSLDPHLKTLLVTGGSQGAQAINDALSGALTRLLKEREDVQVLHQAGDKNLEDYLSRLPDGLRRHDRYQLRAYIDDLAVAYAMSDLTIARAGAMTISELTVSGTPAIFIPYPFAAQNHQEFNARSIERNGGAVLIIQKELSADLLCRTVLSLLSDEEKLAQMRSAMKSMGRPNATADIAQQLMELSARFQKAPVG